MANHNGRRAQIRCEHEREVISRQITQGFVKAQQPHGIEACTSQDAPALPPRGEPGWRILRPEVFPGHRFEGQKHGRPPQAGGLLGEAANQGLVTQMNPVERPNGEDRAAVTVAQVLQSANKLHGSSHRRQRFELYGNSPLA